MTNINGDNLLNSPVITSGYCLSDVNNMQIAYFPYMPQMQKEERQMRGLFEVFVVDPEEADSEIQIVYGDQLIAKDEMMAKIKAWARALQKIDGIRSHDPDDFDIIVRKIGDVRAKREPQDVRVITG